MVTTVEEIRKILTDWKNKHNWEFNPRRPLKGVIDWLVQNNMRCMCDKNRVCPCPESVDEVQTLGRCRCGFFLTQAEKDRIIRKYS